MNRLYSKEELPKINEEDVNVYMRKEKKKRGHVNAYMESIAN
jgi:hypothetical protein